MQAKAATMVIISFIICITTCVRIKIMMF